MIALKRDEFRGDFEVIDAQHKHRGFVWKYADHWCIRIDDRATEYRDTYDEAAILANEICSGK